MAQVNFDSLPSLNGGIFKFKEVGDKIQGTLVGKRVVPDGFHQGQDQIVYDIMLESGEVQSVFGKPGIDRDMKYVKLGQYIKMEFISITPNKNPAFKPSHNIKVFSDSKLVNTEWLNSQEEEGEVAKLAADFGGTVVSGNQMPSFMDDIDNKTAPAVTVAAAPTKDEQIFEKARVILGATKENYKQVVMEATKLAYLESNYDQILSILK